MGDIEVGINERSAIVIVAGLLAIGVAAFIALRETKGGPILSVTTPLFTGILLWYYYYFVGYSSHGMAILILPLATGWLWWRRRQTGRPALSTMGIILLQAAYGWLYVLLVNLQEH